MIKQILTWLTNAKLFRQAPVSETKLWFIYGYFAESDLIVYPIIILDCKTLFLRFK